MATGEGLDRLVAALDRSGWQPRARGDRWEFLCGVHGDGANRAGEARQGQKGALVHCHAGCATTAVLDAIGLTPADLFDEERPKKPGTKLDWSQPDNRWDYVDVDGAYRFSVLRWQQGSSKTIRQGVRNDDGSWRYGLKGVDDRPLYRLPQLVEAVAAGRMVWIVEGEKCADALIRAGEIATTCPMGAGKWREDYAQIFRGALVSIVIDRDEAGRKHGSDVWRSIEAVAGDVAGYAVPCGCADPNCGCDIADWLGWDRPLEGLVAWQPAAELQAVPTAHNNGVGSYGRPLVMADVEAEHIEWLWDKRIPIGKLTLLAGDPGVGKGMVTCGLAAALSVGGILPDADRPTECGTYFVSYEDGPADSLRPRLDACGANVARVVVTTHSADDKGQVRGFRPAEDLAALDAWLSANPTTRLVIVDPLMSIMGGSDSTDIFRDNDVRSSLDPWVAMATRRRVALVGVMHLRKAEAERALYRVSGAGGFVQLARSVLLVARDDDSGRKSVSHMKSNIGPLGEPVEFSIDDEGRFWWGQIAPDLTPEKMLASGRAGRPASDRDEATDFLKEMLDGRPMRVADILNEATERGFARRTIYRAADVLSVHRYTDNGKFWALEVPDGGEF